MNTGYRLRVSMDATRRSTSTSILALIRTQVEAQLGLPLPGLDKRELLARLPRPSDAFAVGHAIVSWGAHPVIRAVVGAPSPEAVLKRWQSIEAFGHPSHRTQIVQADDTRVELHHVCLEGGLIPPFQDFFIWGLMAGLLELWGSAGVRVVLPTGTQIGNHAILVEPTTHASMHVEPRHAADFAPPTDAGCVNAVAAAVQTDLPRGWTVADVAACLHMSSRSLQRHLRAAEATFSAVLQRTRVEAAVALIQTSELGLAEVAFCTGFSDHAHLTRTTRKLLDVPPSSLRTLLNTIG